MFWSPNEDDLPCPGALRHRQCGNPDRPCALHDNDVLPIDSSSFEAMDRRDQSATRANHRLRWQIVRQLENRCSRTQIMHLRISAQKMRRFIAAMADSISAPMRAACWLAFLRAVIALAARDRRIPCYAIANLQRLPCPINIHSIAKLFD